MYSNVAHYGGDAHIWTRQAAERLREAGPHGTSEASLCEHHAVTEASDLFHVRDVVPDWRTFLGEDTVCDECAQEWLERRGLTDDTADSPDDDLVDAAQYAAFVEYGQEGGAPAHPNCRSGFAPITDGSIEVENDLEQAGREVLEQAQREREVEVEVTVEGEDARRLAEWLREQGGE